MRWAFVGTGMQWDTSQLVSLSEDLKVWGRVQTCKQKITVLCYWCVE